MQRLLLLALFLLTFSPLRAQTPKLVHSRSLAAPGESGNSFKIQYGGALGTGTLSGNLLTLRMTYPHGSTVSSIGDNQSSTYALGVSTDSGTGGWVTALYYVPGVAPGITQLTVTFSASVLDWHAAVQEYSGVATNAPADGTCSNHSTTVQCSAAITTTSNNDLIVASTIGLGSEIYDNRMTSVAPEGNFILDSADTNCSDADEEYVQPSAGSITPSFTIGGNAQAFNIVAMAFKASAGAGTNPTGMNILHQQHLQIGSASNTQVSYFVSSGNLLVASLEVGNSGNSVTIDNCTPSNTWTKRTPSGSNMPQIFFLPSTGTFSTSLHCTVNSTAPGNRGIIVVYDVVGAAASPEDVDSAGTAGTGATVTDMPVVTPNSAPGIAFAAENDGIGPATGVGSGFIWDNTPYTGESDGGQLNNGDGWQHFYYTNTSQFAFSWTQADSASFMQAFAIAFKAGNTVNGQPDFSISPSGTTTQTVTAGQTATFSDVITVAPLNGFSAQVNLSCSLPVAATATTCTVNPNMFASGSGTASVQVTTTQRGILPPASPHVRLIPQLQMLKVAVLALLLYVLLLCSARTRHQRFASALPLATLALFVILQATGCGGGGSNSILPPPQTGTPAGTYTITVTGVAPSTNTTHTSTLQLVVN